MQSSSSASIDEDMVRESLECPICKEYFEEPKQLSCGHTFCKNCIDQLDKSTSTSHRPGVEFGFGYATYDIQFSVQCPQCRQMCIIPQSGLSTNYVVKAMVEKFREFGFSSDDAANKEKLTCCNCARISPTCEMYLCKDCKEKKQLYLCSLCIVRQHREHDFIVCTEMASTQERDDAAAQIEKMLLKATGFVEQMKTIYVELSNEFMQVYHQLKQKLNRFDYLNIECYSELNLLKQDIEDQVNEAKLLEARYHQAISEFIRIRRETHQGFNALPSIVSPNASINYDASSSNAGDLIDFGQENSRNAPSTSTSMHSNLAGLLPSFLNSPTNHFAYTGSGVDNKKARTKHSRQRRRNVAEADESAQSIVLE